jgi:hypothetical protein
MKYGIVFNFFKCRDKKINPFSAKILKTRLVPPKKFGAISACFPYHYIGAHTRAAKLMFVKE